MSDFFKGIDPLRFDPDAEGLAFRHYDPDEEVMGKRLEDHLRFAVAYWHSFAWPGGDPFGGQTFDRPWFGDDMAAARLKAEVAFEMFEILNVPFFCWHDHDIRPEGASFAESKRNFDEIIDLFEQKMETSKTRLLWGTANLFSHRRFMSGASTNPDPDVFAWSAATIKTCLDATHRLNGENYVLWGGREGYETLLNTDLGREMEQMGRMLSMVVDYKHKIGFKGQILIEPKPQEPTKHQYDYDVATVYGFLQRFGLEKEVKVNIEQGHAILAGHSFEHELALARELGATHAFRGDDPDLVEKLREASGGGYHCGLDTTGIPAVVDTASQALRKRGMLALVAAPAPGTRYSVEARYMVGAGLSWRGVIEGDSNPPDFIPELIEYYRKGQLSVEKIIAHYPFEQINEAIHAMEDGSVVNPVLRMMQD